MVAEVYFKVLSNKGQVSFFGGNNDEFIKEFTAECANRGIKVVVVKGEYTVVKAAPVKKSAVKFNKYNDSWRLERQLEAIIKMDEDTAFAFINHINSTSDYWVSDMDFYYEEDGELLVTTSFEYGIMDEKKSELKELWGSFVA